MDIKDEELREIRELDADSRGRVTIGRKYADQTVKVAVIDFIESEEDN
jgi:hypothetical protein